jgi:hypothetical protein
LLKPRKSVQIPPKNVTSRSDTLSMSSKSLGILRQQSDIVEDRSGFPAPRFQQWHPIFEFAAGFALFHHSGLSNLRYPTRNSRCITDSTRWNLSELTRNGLYEGSPFSLRKTLLEITQLPRDLPADLNPESPTRAIFSPRNSPCLGQPGVPFCFDPFCQKADF